MSYIYSPNCSQHQDSCSLYSSLFAISGRQMKTYRQRVHGQKNIQNYSKNTLYTRVAQPAFLKYVSWATLVFSASYVHIYVYIYNHTASLFTYTGLYMQVRVHNHSTLLIIPARMTVYTGFRLWRNSGQWRLFGEGMENGHGTQNLGESLCWRPLSKWYHE